jgi:hypothetical protein
MRVAEVRQHGNHTGTITSTASSAINSGAGYGQSARSL